MPALSKYINVQISLETNFPSREGFGSCALLAYHTQNMGSRTVRYSTIDSVGDDFPVSSNIYRKAQKFFGQNPRPSGLTIIRQTNPSVKTFRIFPQTAVEGQVYTFNVIDNTGTVFPITRTVPPASSIAAECTAIAALVDALALVVATATATYVEITGSTAANYVRLSGLPGPTKLKILDNTAVPADLINDLIDAQNEDPQGWFFLTANSESKAETLAIAAWIETQNKMFMANSSDSENTENAVTTGVASQLMAASYKQTATAYRKFETEDANVMGYLGRLLPTDLDTQSTTGEYKQITGVTPDKLTDNEIAQLEMRNMGYYTYAGPLPSQLNTKVAVGEWIDVIHQQFWYQSRLQTDIFFPIHARSNSGSKFGFDDNDIATLAGLVEIRAELAVGTGFLAADPKYTVTYPKAVETEAADRSARRLRNIRHSARIKGAIHFVDPLVVTLTV